MHLRFFASFIGAGLVVRTLPHTFEVAIGLQIHYVFWAGAQAKSKLKCVILEQLLFSKHLYKAFIYALCGVY